jgi:L-asparaginase
LLILNTGGTFNKKYNALNGELEVAYDNEAIKAILDSTEEKIDLAGVMYKDSLDMTLQDRKMLSRIILESTDDVFVIVHGTDTMSETAEFLAGMFDDRAIVLVGAMRPFAIDKIEASLNLGMAMGFAKGVDEYGVYICMNGFVEHWDKIKKNKKFGKFELVK